MPARPGLDHLLLEASMRPPVISLGSQLEVVPTMSVTRTRIVTVVHTQPFLGASSHVGQLKAVP